MRRELHRIVEVQDTPLGNHPLPQVARCSLDQVSWLPSSLLARLPMGLPQWHCEPSYSVQLREQRPDGTSLFQRGCVQKKASSLYWGSCSLSRLMVKIGGGRGGSQHASLDPCDNMINANMRKRRGLCDEGCVIGRWIVQFKNAPESSDKMTSSPFRQYVTSLR